MQTLLKRWTHALLEWLGLTSATGDALDRWAAFVLVVLAAVVFDLLLQLGIVHGVRKLVERTRAKWDDTLFSVPVLRRMCHILSAILLAVVLPVVFEEKSTGRVIVLRFMEAYIVFSVFRFVNALLYAAFHIAAARPAWQNKPIKGLRQTAQGIALLICTILIVSILLDKSPAILLTGLGASAAVLMLIFRDSILGLVAGVQLSANDMLRPGDWITMAKYGADGYVTEVTLTTVKVQNFDKTITTIPPYALVSDSFQNWRGMWDSGGRRIKRSLLIDASSVHNCTAAELAALREKGLAGTTPDAEPVVNLYALREYAARYLKGHPGIHPDLMQMVRMLQPTPEGIPVEVYCFTRETDWVAYEAVQGAVFDHLFAVLPDFGLRAYQRSSDRDPQSSES